MKDDMDNDDEVMVEEDDGMMGFMVMLWLFLLRRRFLFEDCDI